MAFKEVSVTFWVDEVKNTPFRYLVLGHCWSRDETVSKI
jgi:hypothetical protein